MTGEKGGNVTLPCEFEARQISDLVLSRLSKRYLFVGVKDVRVKLAKYLKKEHVTLLSWI